MEINRLREDTQNSLTGMHEALSGKASKEELGELEAKIINMINEMLKRLLTQFADNKETQKRLSDLEKSVRISIDFYTRV